MEPTQNSCKSTGTRDGGGQFQQAKQMAQTRLNNGAHHVSHCWRWKHIHCEYISRWICCGRGWWSRNGARFVHKSQANHCLHIEFHMLKGRSFENIKNIQILPIDTLQLPNTPMDAGSTTSVATCATVQQACGVLVQRLSPLKEELSKAQFNGNASWENLCLTAKMRGIDLQSHERWTSPNYKYLIYGTGVSEVEVNILTVETRVLAADIIYDAGKSLNHLVDIGQVEGAFVFGIGFFLTEEILRDSKGKVVSDATWTYKPPTIDIIPQSFNVELYQSPYHNDQIFSSKAVGEPPLLLSSSVFSAVRMAISAARKDYMDVGGSVESEVFDFSPPAT